jgi:hypothetical protein
VHTAGTQVELVSLLPPEVQDTIVPSGAHTSCGKLAFLLSTIFLLMRKNDCKISTGGNENQQDHENTVQN